MPLSNSENKSISKFPVRLRNRMNERGINAAVLARRIKVSQTAVSKWLGGENAPGPHSLFKLAHELRIDEAYLAGRIDDAVKDIRSPFDAELGSETIAAMVEGLRKKIAQTSGYELDRVKLTLEFV